MNSKILAFLDNTGLVINGNYNASVIKNASLAKLVDISEEFSEITSHKEVKPQYSTFNHAASVSLGAGKYPCSCDKCRLNKAEQLAQFAAFYSNHVYINNFMDSHLASPDRCSVELKKDMETDIKVISYLYPLLKADLVSFVTYGHYTPRCLGKYAVSEGMTNKFEESCEVIANRFLAEVEFEIKRGEGGEIWLVTVGPEDLIPNKSSHNMILKVEEKHKLFTAILNELQVNRVVLTKNEIKKLGLHHEEADYIIRNIAIELCGAKFLKSTYLSDSDVEIKYLNHLSAMPTNMCKSKFMQQYLTCFVPFLHNINTLDIIRLRDNENESFILFRQAITKAIEEYKIAGTSFTEHEAISLFEDVVRPAISRLDIKFKTAKVKFAKNTVREVLAWSAVLSVGFYSGAFPSSLLAGSAAFAVAKYGADFLKNAMGEGDSEDGIKEDPMYFLWKVTKLQ